MEAMGHSTAARSAASASFTVRPLSKAIGAEIVGLDISQPLDDETRAALRQAWHANNILLFRGQDLSEDAQIRFSETFGPLAMRVAARAGFKPTPIMLVSNIREDGKFIGELPDGEMWFHSDQCFSERPCAGSLLYAIEVPREGGNTLFANAYGAYEALPAATKARIAGLKAMNIYEYDLNLTKRTQKESDSAPRYAHPIVRTHPATGRKALYVNRLMTAYVEGLSSEESKALLTELYDHQERDEFVYSHAWRAGDLMLWDNRCTLHARTDFDPSERRLLRRVTVLGDKPF